MNSTFYESGRKVYYFGRTNGKNEDIGWHVRGKMGGLWFENVRLFSSITLSRGDDILTPDKFTNNIHHKILVFGETALKFVAHPHESTFAISLADYKPNDALNFQVDPTPTWLEEEKLTPVFEIVRRRAETVIIVSLNEKRKFFIRANTPSVKIKDDIITIIPQSNPLTCTISGDSVTHVPFDSVVGVKKEYYSKFLPADKEDIKFWAQLNALDLYFEREAGEGYVAGLPEFPWWFGIDSVYTGLGLLRTSQIELVKASIENLARFGDGLAPHEVTTAGRIYARARINELPAFAYLVTRYVALTGEVSFMKLVDTACKRLLSSINKDGYPVGEGIVEVPGTEASAMLDSASWFYKLLFELESSGLIDHLECRSETKPLLEKLHKNFIKVWGNEELFFDAISGGEKYFFGHFIQIYPLALELVPKEYGKRALETMKERGFFTNNGMIHTLPLEMFEAGEYGPTDKNSIVWSLPTALALKAAINYGDTQLEAHMRSSFEEALKIGMPGAIPEILPDGGCTVQAWNAFLVDVL
ncbi:hypothetical protein [Kosmotoga pacifica]|uniref:Glycogen debranching protein n=1 Tax=Kosmotoga pacifica TaxID=1330330 RepID=A0A0G2Z7T1_9BACT|nr:hypothetical protein [Kosmotoga pacifica]AKI97607.1 hypothetical protein IX53_06995 [Kosmotoga pacifica]